MASARQIIVCVLMIFSAVATSSSQTNPEKTATASISGKVTVKNKGIAGVAVFAHKQNVAGAEGYRGITDQTGTYRIQNLRAGTYDVMPVAPSLALQDEIRNNAVVVNEGESVDDVNFSMVQGGVITGKVLDADGRPLIEADVVVLPVSSQYGERHFIDVVHTDDRGIYRFFGLRPGKYKVSVGRERPFPTDTRVSYRQTFYPSVTNYEKAQVIEVTEGGEAKDIDIVVGRPLQVFTVSGRIVDAETGKPLSNVRYGLNQNLGGGSSASIVGRNSSNANGEFRLDNVLPGKYMIFIVPEDSDVRADSVSFEVVDRDLSDLVINAGKAASLSGVVVFEGAEESATPFKPNDLFIYAAVENTGQYFPSSAHIINADGSFRIRGLQKGSIRFSLTSRTRNDLKPIDIVRVERDGIVQTTGLTLKDAEQVTGVRLFVKHLTGAIHGQVKVEGDELVSDSQLSLSIIPLDTNRSWYQSSDMYSSAQLDSRKHFAVEGLAAGTYEVNLMVYGLGGSDTDRNYKQQVTVTDNAVSEVTITINAKP